MGSAGVNGGEAGDLLIRVNVHPDEGGMERRGSDLHSALQVGVYDAMLGGRVAVQTPRGEKMLDVPEGVIWEGDICR